MICVKMNVCYGQRRIQMILRSRVECVPGTLEERCRRLINKGTMLSWEYHPRHFKRIQSECELALACELVTNVHNSNLDDCDAFIESEDEDCSDSEDCSDDSESNQCFQLTSHECIRFAPPCNRAVLPSSSSYSNELTV
jgi:hypothetical protein